MSKSIANHKVLYIDALKIFAAFLVIFNHLPGYTLYYISDGVKEWGYLAVTMLTRANVPLFFMISGALLIPKQEDYKSLILNRVLRYAIVIVVVNALIYGIWHIGAFQIKNLIQGILRGSIQSSYWFLYAYLGMLIMLPFLRKVAVGFSKADFIWMVIFRFAISSLLPIVSFIAARGFGVSVSISTQFQIPLFVERTIFYPLAGYYLDRVVKEESLEKKKLVMVILAALLGIFLSSAITYQEGVSTGFTQNYVQLFDYVTAMACFVLFKYFFAVYRKTSENSCVEKIIHGIAGVTFGIYLFDPVLKKYLYNPFESFFEPLMPTIIVSFLWCITSMTICGFATWILRRSRVIRKFL